MTATAPTLDLELILARADRSWTRETAAEPAPRAYLTVLANAVAGHLTQAPDLVVTSPAPKSTTAAADSQDVEPCSQVPTEPSTAIEEEPALVEHQAPVATDSPADIGVDVPANVGDQAQPGECAAVQVEPHRHAFPRNERSGRISPCECGQPVPRALRATQRGSRRAVRS